MKNYIYLFSAMLTMVAFISCSNDDDAKDGCSQSNWVGTYSGSCDGVAYDLNVTPEGNNRINLELVVPNGTDTSTNAFDDCNYTFVLGGIQISATLDGNMIIYSDSTLSCSPITFTRT